MAIAELGRCERSERLRFGLIAVWDEQSALLERRVEANDGNGGLRRVAMAFRPSAGRIRGGSDPTRRVCRRNTGRGHETPVSWGSLPTFPRPHCCAPVWIVVFSLASVYEPFFEEVV